MTEQHDLVARLRGMFVRFATETEDEAAIRRKATALEAAARIEALEARERVLREALEPFETMAHTYDCDDDEDGKPEIPDKRRLRIEEANGDLSESIIDVGDFRRARRALAGDAP